MTDHGFSPANEGAPAPSGRRLAWFIGILAFVWLALSSAGVILLVTRRATGQLDLVDWAAIIAGISAPLALIGVGMVLALRMEAARSGGVFARAEALFADAGNRMHGEIETLRSVMNGLQQDVDGQRQDIARQAQQLLAAGEGFASLITDTSARMSGEVRTLQQVANALTEAAGAARTDLGVLMADLPHVEVLARNISASLGDLGAQARSQTADLEEQLTAIVQRAAQASEAAASLGQRLAGQIATIESGIDRTGGQMDAVAQQLGQAADAALVRATQMLDTTRTAVLAQNEALSASVESARASFMQAGTDAMQGLVDSVATLETRLGALDDRLGGQDKRVQALLAHCTDYMDRLEARLTAIGELGERRTRGLADAVAALGHEVETINTPLSAGEESAARLAAEVNGLTRSMDDLARLVQNVLPEHFSTAQQAFTQMTSGLGDLDARLARLGERQLELAHTSEQIGTSVRSGMESLSGGLEQAQNRLDQWQGNLRDSEALLRGIDSETAQAAASTSQALTEATAQIRRSTEQAADHIRSVLAAIVEEAQASLALAGENNLSATVDEKITARIRQLGEASDAATTAARMAADQLSNQLVIVNDAAAAIEARIAEANSRMETDRREEFSRRSALLIEALNSTAIDVARILSHDIADTAWAAYLKGDRSVFARRAVQLLDRGEARAIQRHYEEDGEFAEQVNRYVHDFEAVIRRVLAERDGGPMAVAMLSSDVGKLYVALAQGIERLRN